MIAPVVRPTARIDRSRSTPYGLACAAQVGHHPKLVVADFGISKIVPAGLGAAPTPANSALATIRAYTAAYASPQQKKFLPADRRDDVYALAVLWYQLLRGDLSLERPSGDGWKRALTKLGVSEADVALLNRSWDDEQEERPADGNELAGLLVQREPAPEPISIDDARRKVEEPRKQRQAAFRADRTTPEAPEKLSRTLLLSRLPFTAVGIALFIIFCLWSFFVYGAPLPVGGLVLLSIAVCSLTAYLVREIVLRCGRSR